MWNDAWNHAPVDVFVNVTKMSIHCTTRAIAVVVIILLLSMRITPYISVTDPAERHKYPSAAQYGTNIQIVKGNRNAVYLVDDKGVRHIFPDFYTYQTMGFENSIVKKIPDTKLEAMPLGDPVKPIPVFRPDDYFYHEYCEDFPRYE